MEFLIFIMIIILMSIYFKINDMTFKLAMMEKKLLSLQHSINTISQGDQKPISKKIEVKKEKIVKIKPKLLQKPEILFEESPRVIESTLSEKLQARFGSKSLEDFLIGNLLLTVSILAFVLSIGFFLKYSIDQNWIPIWGRVLIGVVVAMVMLFGGIKTIKNSHKLFSEGLFGGGIAILYLSVFAGFALEGFAFLNFNVAFGTMIIITVLAGLISVRYDSMTTAVFGIVGGFATPFLINTGSNNIQALMLYILVLNLGLLYIAFSQKWSLLNWLGFIFSMLVELGAIYKSVDLFIFLSGLFFIFFIIYSIVPFLYEIRTKEIKLTPTLVILFGANLLIFLAFMGQLIDQYDIYFKYFSIVTIITATYLLGYAYWLKQRGIFTNNLLYAILAQASALLVITPAILFEGDILAVVWAVESIVMFAVAKRSGEKTFLWFGILGLVLTFLRYLGVNLLDTYNIIEAQYYLDNSLSRVINAIIIIGVFFVSYKFSFNEMMEKTILEYRLKEILLGSGVFLLFIFFNVEISSAFGLFIPKAQQISVTILWILFGIGMFVISLYKNISIGKELGITLIIIAIMKAFFSDLSNVDSLYRILLFMFVGVLLFVLAYFYKKREGKRDGI